MLLGLHFRIIVLLLLDLPDHIERLQSVRCPPSSQPIRTFACAHALAAKPFSILMPTR